MILRDPVHGLVSFESEEEAIVVDLLATTEVQRLRRIRQLGVANLAFPGAEHSRFVHAVGTAHVMKRLLARLREIHEELPFWQRVSSDRARDALAAALLHDIGHGPLSHLFEDAIAGSPHHEEWTTRIIKDPSSEVHRVLAKYDPGMPERVSSLIHGGHPLSYLAKAVSGTLDVDRADYLLRDAHATGVRYGLFDLDWLLRSLRFTPATEGASPGLAIDGAKGLPAIEGFLLARLFMFQQVYLHKATRSAEWMIRTALKRASDMLADGQRLAGVPAAMTHAAQGVDIALADYLAMDDGVLNVALQAWESEKDAALADLSRRIRNRALYKSYELFGELATPDGKREALAVAQDIAKARGLDPDVYVGLDLAQVTPLETDAAPLLVVFQKGEPRPLAEVSFVLGRLSGQTLTRTRLIIAPELKADVVAALATKNG